jgi:hypothetical protein
MKADLCFSLLLLNVSCLLDVGSVESEALQSADPLPFVLIDGSGLRDPLLMQMLSTKGLSCPFSGARKRSAERHRQLSCHGMN